MDNQNFIQKQEDSIVVHIFAVSAAMVGVCLTVIGILNVTSTLRKIETFGDDIMAVDALIFLLSCVTAYVAMRIKDKQQRLFIERLADTVFMGGLSLMVIICFLIVSKFV